MGLEFMLKQDKNNDENYFAEQPNIISSKFAPPKPPAALITRFTLSVILKEIDLKNFVMITAPAGYGKTTLLNQLKNDLLKTGKKVTWLSLDENDTRISQFITYLIKSLHFVGIPIGDAALAAYQKPSKTQLEDFRNCFINEIHAYKTPIVVILDDLHYIKNNKIVELIDELISYAPPNLCIVIASRHEPSLSTSRYRIHGTMIEINYKELKFSYEEAHNFIQRTLESPEDDYSLSRRLYEFTDGWVAALQLAMISVKNSDNVDRLLDSYKGSKTQLSEFLYTDVLSSLPEDIITFLSKTSILRDMNADLCMAVSGFINSEELLEQIKQLNLFLLSVENKEGWYTYHPRFREFLHANLLKLPAVDIQELNWKASEWYESQNLIADALQHALNGNDDLRTLKLLENAAISFLSEGQFQALIEWHEILNPPLIEDYPNFWIATAYSLMLCFRISDSQEMIKKIKKTKVYEDELVQFRLSVIDLTIAMYEDNREKIFSLHDNWPKVFPFLDRLFVPAALNPVSIAFAQIGELQKARDIYNYLIPIPEKQRAFIATTYQQCYLAHTYFQEGRLEIAEKYCRDRLTLSEKRLGYFSVASCATSAFFSEILYEKNCLRELFVMLSERMGIICENLTPDGIIKPYVSLAKAYQANNDTEKALANIQELYLIGQKNSQRRFLINALGIRVQIFLQMDDLIAAQETLRELENIVSGDNLKPPLANEEYILASLARVYLQFHENDYKSALSKLTIIRESKIYPRQHNLGVKIDALICVCNMRLKPEISSLPQVLEVLKAGEKIGLVRTFLDDTAFMECIKPHTAEILSYNKCEDIRNYLLLLLDQDQTQHDALLVPHTTKGADAVFFTDQDKQILRLIAHGLPNKVIAHKLDVSIDTIKYHLKKIYVKTNTSGRTEAIFFAQRLGLIEK